MNPKRGFTNAHALSALGRKKNKTPQPEKQKEGSENTPETETDDTL